MGNRMALKVNQIRNIVKRLCESSDLSNREIASRENVAPNSVNVIAKQLPNIAYSWSELKELTDTEFLAAFRGNDQDKKSDDNYPNWLDWHTDLQSDKDVTVKLLWEEWHVENPEGISYSHAARLYLKWVKKQRISMRKINLPGENSYLDFAGRKIRIYEKDGHTWRDAEIFVATLGASSYSFCMAVWTQSIPDWIECNVKALEYFGGAPRFLIPDNLKSAVTKNTPQTIIINPTFAEFADHYSTVVLPARVRKPNDKGPVEVSVQLIQRWILAALRDIKFYSLDEANAGIKRLLEIFNNKEMKAYKASRLQRFELLDKPALKMLPQTRYSYGLWRLNVRVGENYHVLYEGHYYSVPHVLRHSFVDVRAGSKTLELMHNGKQVAIHIISTVSGGYTTEKHHMPASHQQYADGGVDKLIEWARKVGESTEKVFGKHLTESRHLPNGIRTAKAIQKLGIQHSSERLEEVCEYALKINSITHSSILSIFRSKVDKRNIDDIGTEKHGHHINIRGGDYYKLGGN